MKAKDVMTVDVVSVSTDHSVRHAARIMLNHRISGLPVIDDAGRVVGIITEGDLMRRSELGAQALAPVDRQFSTEENHAGAYVKSHSWKVADVMTSDPAKVDEETPLPRIAALMVERGIKRVPMMKEEHLVGIVSRTDLLRILITATFDATAPGDDAIRRSILTRLREDAGIKGGELDLTVADGLVHVSGAVSSQSERDAVRVVAEGVRGVKGVFDHLSLA
ncbi:CBS domain-containing protein [Aminobacter ciceronei]|uniref:CBS domain-containing protein n=1 Tax=Aminobacter ciceronei TaxID=150723 RepID=A0ABR6C0H0_9HYPH|nr:CBS domain-containing protein [Aminobacter ciceronei]MBA8904979.1 CBS domain-containing protein [Aminobacter ciceronei]MBA9018467.1 CBS domain-containing protein [Aminobacter ciceronei]